jgi:multidrug efflux pump subunit AcrA (membrane-fusion protein)
MYADVILLANSRPDALTIPITAVVRSDNKTSVLVVDSQDRVQVREVRLGVESPNRAEVLGGLREGERVIVGNLGSYQAGEVVKPKQAVFTGAESSTDAD